MTETGPTFPRILTPYEAEQVREIGAWKSLQPSLLTAVVDGLTSPITGLVGHLVPRRVVTKLVASMESIAARADVVADVARAAGAEDIGALASAPLEECDRLARLFTARAERFALLEGAAVSFGGPLFHIPQQLVASLRSIARIGHCYGYPLATRFDHGVAIDILEIAMLRDATARTDLIASLHTAIDRHDDSTLAADAHLVRASRNMITDEVLDLIPVVGSAVSFLFDSQFMHAVDETARRIFQERWLRDRGLVSDIPPAPLRRRHSSREELGQALGGLLYCVGAVAGFGVTVPCRIVQHVCGRPGNPLGTGSRRGADRAVADARDVLAGLRQSAADRGWPADAAAASG